jgi:hypothetical protein
VVVMAGSVLASFKYSKHNRRALFEEDKYETRTALSYCARYSSIKLIARLKMAYFLKINQIGENINQT